MPNLSHMDMVTDAEVDREYSAEPRARHRDPVPFRGRFKSLRSVFFGIAAFWGFTVGATATAIALVGANATIRWEGSSVVALAVGAVAAVVGGFVASRAYREIKSRR